MSAIAGSMSNYENRLVEISSFKNLFFKPIECNIFIRAPMLNSLSFTLAGILGASLAPYIATWIAGRYGLRYRERISYRLILRFC